MSNPIDSEMIMKKARELRATQSSKQFNPYAYLMKHSEKACLMNLPVDSPETLFTPMINGKMLIIINEKINKKSRVTADVAIEKLIRELTTELARIELGEYATDENVMMLVKFLLDE